MTHPTICLPCIYPSTIHPSIHTLSTSPSSIHKHFLHVGHRKPRLNQTHPSGGRSRLPWESPTWKPRMESGYGGIHSRGIIQGPRGELQNLPRERHGPVGAFLEEAAPSFPCSCLKGQRIQSRSPPWPTLASSCSASQGCLRSAI